MNKRWLISCSKSLSRKENNQNACNSRDLSMKSRSNNSLDMSVDNQKPFYDSLIHKSEIDELENIKENNS